MKALILVFGLISLDQAFAAVDFSACDAKAKICDRDTVKSCAEYYSCQTYALNQLNALLGFALREANVDMVDQCRAKRDDMETDIWAHATTIECVDSEDGPHFGG
ncbi:MAG: hypothetical protein AB7F86_16215 [Bdellovibrionales bacterium]